jgi:hypothetical protein
LTKKTIGALFFCPLSHACTHVFLVTIHDWKVYHTPLN